MFNLVALDMDDDPEVVNPIIAEIVSRLIPSVLKSMKGWEDITVAEFAKMKWVYEQHSKFLLKYIEKGLWWEDV